MKLLRGALTLPVLTGVAIWGELVRLLGFHWSGNPQYAYGWSVPFLTAILLWDAWLIRPRPEAARLPGWSLGLSLLFAAVLLPARLFIEATPDWRFPLWVATAAVMGLTLQGLWLAGGRPWLRHFAPAILFFLVGVPWPVKIEQPVIDGLTQAVASLTVGGLNLLGTPAIGRGHLIEISTGIVGIEEACSGIRSFQAGLMASLFLGQFFLLRGSARVLLLVAGAVTAFVCNVIRAGSLAWIADRQGLAAVHTWHDSAGYSILVICFVVLFFVARLLRPAEAAPPPSQNVPPPFPFPAGWCRGLALWVALVGLGTEAWFRTAAPRTQPWWRVEWPWQEPGYADLETAELQPAMQADDSRGARWRTESGREFTMYFFRWLPGPASSRMLARFHRPEVCMPATGVELVAETAPETVETEGVKLRFRTYLFHRGESTLRVFFCVWEDQEPVSPEAAVMESWTPRTRWQAVRQKRRELGQQVLEVGLMGTRSEEEARTEFRRQIVPLIRQDPRRKMGQT